MRIPPELRDAIKKSIANGVPDSHIARTYGVTNATVARIRAGKGPKYPPEMIQALRSGAAEGTPVTALARRYGVSLSQAHRWIKNTAARADALPLPPEVVALSIEEQEIYRLTSAMLLKGGAGPGPSVT